MPLTPSLNNFKATMNTSVSRLTFQTTTDATHDKHDSPIRVESGPQLKLVKLKRPSQRSSKQGLDRSEHLPKLVTAVHAADKLNYDLEQILAQARRL